MKEEIFEVIKKEASQNNLLDDQHIKQFLTRKIKGKKFKSHERIWWCIDICNPKEQSILKKYRKENFAEKELVYSERKAIGKCPLTPEEIIIPLRPYISC
ncbi:O-fucosyltransferase 1 [Camellia lanceoleosa]|uniref:O-fucosyltransferase 1 n=1 Tax=Camellia lanceoleosa TaxID=1840588 RepID=A0ACC0F8U0_9ERIC|nr:O-fucosyltransferase 1 [Camellia lanceoleosa]